MTTLEERSKDRHFKCHSLLHRTAIAVCLGTGLFFAFRAATPDARATAAVQAVTVSETVDAAVPDTVLTTCNIEDIQAGDLVLARDQHGQEIGLKPVKEVYKRTSFHLRHLTFESTDGDQQTLSTTDEHPFWSVSADEFLEAGSLPVGHQVTDPHGKNQTLVSSTRNEFPNGIPVFNFQVEDFHTYYVAANAGDDVLLVHNAEYDDLFEMTFQTSKGQVDLIAEKEISGALLHLKDTTVFATGGTPLSGLGREALEARSQLYDQVRSMGFDKLRITANRVGTSTSAKPGKLPDYLIDLTK